MITIPDARTIIALVGAGVTAADGVAGAPHWVSVLTAVVTALMVHINAPSSSTSSPSSAAAARVSPAHPAVLAAAAALLSSTSTSSAPVPPFTAAEAAAFMRAPAVLACNHTTDDHPAADVGDCIRYGLQAPSTAPTSSTGTVCGSCSAPARCSAPDCPMPAPSSSTSTTAAAPSS